MSAAGEDGYGNCISVKFSRIHGFEFFLISWVPTSSYLPLLQEGTTAKFPALDSSHTRPWIIVIIPMFRRQ